MWYKFFLLLVQTTAFGATKGLSALDRAVQGGRVDIASAIIEHGADVNAAGTQR